MRFLFVEIFLVAVYIFALVIALYAFAGKGLGKRVGVLFRFRCHTKSVLWQAVVSGECFVVHLFGVDEKETEVLEMFCHNEAFVRAAHTVEFHVEVFVILYLDALITLGLDVLSDGVD